MVLLNDLQGGKPECMCVLRRYRDAYLLRVLCCWAVTVLDEDAVCDRRPQRGAFREVDRQVGGRDFGLSTRGRYSAIPRLWIIWPQRILATTVAVLSALSLAKDTSSSLLVAHGT